MAARTLQHVDGEDPPHQVRDRVYGAPDLCVEILSPGTERLDRVRKLGL